MSWACWCIYSDDWKPGETWVELVDTDREARDYLLESKDKTLAAYEMGHDGEPTGIMMRLAPQDFLDRHRRLPTAE